MELLRKEVCALADNEAAILGTVREEVDETLKTAEARLQWILVLEELVVNLLQSLGDMMKYLGEPMACWAGGLCGWGRRG
jgi:hypothetical protein